LVIEPIRLAETVFGEIVAVNPTCCAHEKLVDPAPEIVLPLTVTEMLEAASLLAKTALGVPPRVTESTVYGLPSLVDPEPAVSAAGSAGVPARVAVVFPSYGFPLAVRPITVRVFWLMLAVVVGWVSV
jgi:hypothetical protein